MENSEMEKGEADRREHELHSKILQRWSYLLKVQEKVQNQPPERRDPTTVDWMSREEEGILQDISALGAIQKGVNDSRSDQERLWNERHAPGEFVLDMYRLFKASNCDGHYMSTLVKSMLGNYHPYFFKQTK